MAADMQKGVVRAAGEMQSCVPGDRPVYPVLRQLTSKQPIVTQIDGLLTPAECAYIVKTARAAGFEASEIEGRGEIRSLRTPRTADLPEDDPVVQCIERRLATIAGMPATSLEPLQATSYARAERFRSHHDDDEGNTSPQRRLKTVFASCRRRGWLLESAEALRHSISCAERTGEDCACFLGRVGRSCGTIGKMGSETCARCTEGSP